MYESQQHEMQLKTTYASGAEEWYCPTCGRQFVIHWPPGCETITLERRDKYFFVRRNRTGTAVTTKIILETDDEYLVHISSQGEQHVYLPPVTRFEEAAITEDVDPWQEWLEDIDFGDG